MVLIDDADSQITDVVRGADLLSSTARQRVLQKILGLPLPRTLHVPLACDSQGRKLSKQNHAPAFDLEHPLDTLNRVWAFLGFAPLVANSPDEFWSQAVSAWAHRFPLPGPQKPDTSDLDAGCASSRLYKPIYRVSNKRQFLPQQSIYVSIVKTLGPNRPQPEQKQAKNGLKTQGKTLSSPEPPICPLSQISVKFGHWLPKSRSFFNHLGRQPYIHV